MSEPQKHWERWELNRVVDEETKWLVDWLKETNCKIDELAETLGYEITRLEDREQSMFEIKKVGM